MEKLFIQNRNEKKIAVIVEKPEHPVGLAPLETGKLLTGLAFIMHGLSGYKEEFHIEASAKAFLENNYTAVSFDARDTFGESEGNYEDATVTSYYEDLEDVIQWAKTQEWYIEPFCLAAHSLGGLCIILYAEKHPEKIKGIAPTSTIISPDLSMETSMYHGDKIKEWKKTGWMTKESLTRQGLQKRLKYSHWEDRVKYDILPEAHKLTMPVLLMTGEKDDPAPPKHQQILFDKLPGRKEIHIIKDAEHVFSGEKQLNEIKDIMSRWIKTL